MIPFRDLAIGTAVAITGIVESLALFPCKLTGFEHCGRDLPGCGKLQQIALDKLEAYPHFVVPWTS